MKSDMELMLGNEAVARGAYEAGVITVSSYPGTPSTEITEFISKYDAGEVYCEWAPNEKVAAEVAIGSSFAGARSMCCMKHVGLNVAADPLYTVSYTGVNAGLVFVVADDPGMFSSQNEQDTRFHALSAHVPVLEPSDSEECIRFTKLAFDISEAFDTPVILRLTTRVAHQRSLVEKGERAVNVKPYKKDIWKYAMMPAMAKKRHLAVDARQKRLEAFACGAHEELPFNIPNEVIYAENAKEKVGVITYGICYQYSREVFKDASFLKLGLTYPLPEKTIREFASKVGKLIVVEELEPFIENYIKALGIEVAGKEYFTNQGELGTASVRKAYFGVDPDCEALGENVAIPPRPPVFCAGCPHRAVFYVLSKMGLRVCGDIGCYSMGAQAPYAAIDSVICMGASVSMAHGMTKAMTQCGDIDKQKTVAVIGDSTFIHSGITSLIDVAYNKGISTTIILDNSITGMTGHQQNPAMGFTIRNEQTVATDLVKLADAIGIKDVQIVDPFDMKAFREAVKGAVERDNPSVIIAQRPCALLKYVKYGGPAKIDTEKCIRCGSCMRLGCPAINKKEDGTIMIDSSQCVGCGLCFGLCPKSAISK
ncbi:MAG: indolepyruvate ferredoxin oxidoreductase subunit alpha [Clostridia bacterium]|nr:indolepyruvate ferredoxin oxidoreductase subunit alpha [Clostridia bacterium]